MFSCISHDVSAYAVFEVELSIPFFINSPKNFMSINSLGILFVGMYRLNFIILNSIYMHIISAVIFTIAMNIVL